jgi:hypothetical protein
MTRKPPPRKGRLVPSKGKGQVKHSTTIRQGSRGKVLHNEDRTERLEVPIQPGEESASVGYDMKYWASDQNHGMTIGTSAHVKLSCGPGDLDSANDAAAELAWEYLNRNAKRAEKKINGFIDGGK